MVVQVMRRVEHGLSRRERRAQDRRWRKECSRTFDSPSAVFRYLAAFHASDQGAKLQHHNGLIPSTNDHLRALACVNPDFVTFVQGRSPKNQATPDMDATLVLRHKERSLWCYQQNKAYPPFNTYCFEQDLVLHSGFELATYRLATNSNYSHI